MIRQALACSTLVAVLLLGTAVGRTQPKLGVGFYVPELSLDPYNRFTYVHGMAQHLSKRLKTPVTGYTFKSAADFRRELKAKRIQLAVLGGVFLATTQPGKIVASGDLGPRRNSRWCLMSRRKETLVALRGKTLQLPTRGGIIVGLVQNGLLHGNLNIKRHFQIYRSPELLSAVEAVRLKQADVVFAPVSTRGLVPLLSRHLVFPPPAFVVLDKKMPAKRIQKVTAAVRSLRGKAGSLVGWKAPDHTAYRRLRGLAHKRRYRMVMVPPGPTKLRVRLYVSGSIQYELADLDPRFEVP